MSSVTAYVFNNQPVTVLFDSDNNPWFKGKDVANILGYSKTDQALRHNVDEDDKIIYEILNPLYCRGLRGNEKSSIFINESGLYSLILSSRKPEAKAFKKWVTNEVLPSIRKHGEYKLNSENQLLKNENSKLIRSIMQCQETNQQLAMINLNLQGSKFELEQANQSITQKLCEQAPKVAVMPDLDELKHVFCVLVKETLLIMYGVCEYKCIRTEKRSFNKALNKAKQEGFEVCFMQENVPNGINIFNRAKEVMKNYGMHYDCAYNCILTSHDFVNIVMDILEKVSTV